jgi:hypothetical protein
MGEAVDARRGVVLQHGKSARRAPVPRLEGVGGQHVRAFEQQSGGVVRILHVIIVFGRVSHDVAEFNRAHDSTPLEARKLLGGVNYEIPAVPADPLFGAHKDAVDCHLQVISENNATPHASKKKSG